MMTYPPNAPWNPYNPFMPPPAPVTSEEGPTQQPQRGLWPGRYTKITGIVIIAITAVAILAAALGPFLAMQVSPMTVPSGWQKVYDSNLQNTSDWTGDGGCNSTSSGLDVNGISGSADVCTYAANSNNVLTGNGFQLNLSLAPESKLQSPLAPVVQVTDSAGDGFYVAFDDTGNYILCPDANADCSTLGTAGIRDSTVAWHTDGYVANTLAIRYIPNQNTGSVLTLFVNGQEVTSHLVSADLSSGFSIAIGANGDSEALYTSATLYMSNN
jgi:hypothetical protein